MEIEDLEEEFRKLENKEYPPEEDYERFKALIDNWEEWRERTVKEMKYFSAPEQAMKRLQVASMENLIANARKCLKDFQEADERVREADRKIELTEAGLDDTFDELDILSAKRYIIIKHTKPHLFEEFHQISVDRLTPEELNEFLERIAYLEATQLEDILAGK